MIFVATALAVDAYHRRIEANLQAALIQSQSETSEVRFKNAFLQKLLQGTMTTQEIDKQYEDFLKMHE
jgi:hypothetical protein